jgi:diguanylate cyclase (GGDEF)-like protein
MAVVVPIAALGAAAIGLAVGVSPLAGVGAAAAAAPAWMAARTPRRATLLAGQAVPLALTLVLLGLCGAGLDTSTSDQSWRWVVAIGAYPFFGRALLRFVAAHRLIRDPDVTVEAALVGTAVGIVLHVSVGGGVAPTIWGDAASAFPSVLVALDVTLLVIAARGLRSPAGRRGPLGILVAAVLCLTAAHLLQVGALTQGWAVSGPAGTAASASLLLLGAAWLHPAARREPDRLLDDPALFSGLHAGVVAVALLAAPAGLAVQAIRGVAASATIATGAVASGTILACYLVGLLRERASTEHQATHDALTHLPNRTLLVDRLERSLAHAARHGTSCGVLFLDLNRFKEVNDTYGHAAGDQLLLSVAGRLASCVRDEDTVARLSGDEFVVLLPHLGAANEVLIVAQRMLDAIGRPVTVAEERMLVSASIGVAVYPNDGATAAELLASADAAMYRAKELPGSAYEVFSPQLATQAQARLHLEAGLLDALARDELVLHYQPIVDLATGRTAGAEALVRWEHPEQGLLLPGHFVPVAEQSDLIVMLGEKVLFDACRELRHWQDLGFREQTISVNVSSRQFTAGLVSTVTSALRLSGADPTKLVIELTESTVVDNLDEVAATLTELADLGVRAAIDDFGTGYCGLRYLSSLPMASLKIDRSFIQGMTPSAAAIVGATIAMGHSLGLTIVAEGVETEEQHRFLAGQGCDKVQGFLLGRPMPAVALVARLHEERAEAATALSQSPTRLTGLRAPRLAPARGELVRSQVLESDPVDRLLRSLESSA